MGAREAPALRWSIAITRYCAENSVIGLNGARAQKDLAERIPPGAKSNSG